MTPEYSSFQIQQLRMQSAVKTLEAVLVTVFSFMVAAFLPQLLVQYVYSPDITESPALLTHLPLIIFALGAGYFLYALIGNVRREMSAQKMEKELATFAENDECCSDCCGMCGDDCGEDCNDSCCGAGCCAHDEIDMNDDTEVEPTKTNPIAEALKNKSKKKK